MKNRVFGKFKVLTNLKLFSGYKVSVTDGVEVLGIPLLLDKCELEDGLKRVRELNKEFETLEYFKNVVAGSLSMRMKYGR